MIRLFYIQFGIVLVLLLFSSCKKEEITLNVLDPDTTKITLNEVIQVQMKEWYLWYDKIPSVSPDSMKNPEDYLEALLFKPTDKWSYIVPTDQYDKYFKQGKFYGHGFSFGLDSAMNFRIAYVFKNSDLYSAGIQRGWIIKKINNVVPDTVNIWKLLGSNEQGITNAFVFTKPNGLDTTLSFAKREVVMNMVLARDTFHISGKIVGHLVIKGFIANAKNELNEVFDYFNAMNISELVVDLRYNGGGDMGICLHLANLINGKKAPGNTFAQLTYNNKHSNSNYKYKLSADSRSVDISRLFVIASHQSASASEALINGLKSLMDVKVIGQKTYGKPVGMNVWEIKNYNYKLIPITFKLTNQDGYGDYFDGLEVDKFVNDDMTHDFTDKNEACLSEVLHFIQYGSFSDKKKAADQYPVYKHHWNKWQEEIGAY